MNHISAFEETISTQQAASIPDGERRHPPGNLLSNSVLATVTTMPLPGVQMDQDAAGTTNPPDCDSARRSVVKLRNADP